MLFAKLIIKDQTGVSAVEYALAAALIAVGSIGVMTTLGDDVSDTYSAAGTSLADANGPFGMDNGDGSSDASGLGDDSGNGTDAGASEGQSGSETDGTSNGAAGDSTGSGGSGTGSGGGDNLPTWASEPGNAGRETPPSGNGGGSGKCKKEKKNC